MTDDGGLTIVREAVQKLKQKSREVFLPLSHPPGEAQVDYGFADVWQNGELTKVALFVMTLPYSDAVFVQAFPRECPESFLEGHRRAFEDFGGVPTRISYDNSKIAVARFVGNRERKVTSEFLRLKSHYLFADHFCLVRRPNEKGHVERLLDSARRNYLVPVPSVDSLETLNRHLLNRCQEDLNRQLRGKPSRKQTLLAEERENNFFYDCQHKPSKHVGWLRRKPIRFRRFGTVLRRDQYRLRTHESDRIDPSRTVCFGRARSMTVSPHLEHPTKKRCRNAVCRSRT